MKLVFKRKDKKQKRTCLRIPQVNGMGRRGDKCVLVIVTEQQTNGMGQRDG